MIATRSFATRLALGLGCLVDVAVATPGFGTAHAASAPHLAPASHWWNGATPGGAPSRSVTPDPRSWNSSISAPPASRTWGRMLSATPDGLGWRHITPSMRGWGGLALSATPGGAHWHRIAPDGTWWR